jgi:dienelactone hydrolase
MTPPRQRSLACSVTSGLLPRSLAARTLFMLAALGACGEGTPEGQGPYTIPDTGAPVLVTDAAVPMDTGTAAPADAGSVINRPDTGVVRPVDSGSPLDAGQSDGAIAASDAAAGDAAASDAAAGDAATQGDGGDTVAPAGSIQRGPADKAYISKRGPYTTMTYTSGYNRGTAYRAGTIYYPTAADAKPPFAFVAICPGYTASQSSIAGWGPFLASHGIVAMTIDTNDAFEDMAARSRALKGALDSIAGENTRSGSPLNGKLDIERRGSMGWSMGGGGTMLLAETDPKLKAAISLCGYHPGRDFGRVSVPSLLFTATGDGTAQPGPNAIGWYPDLKGKKMLYEVQGGNHSSANNPSSSNYQIGAYGLAWLKIFLENDERYIPIAKSMPTGTAMFQTNL